MNLAVMDLARSDNEVMQVFSKQTVGKVNARSRMGTNWGGDVYTCRPYREWPIYPSVIQTTIAWTCTDKTKAAFGIAKRLMKKKWCDMSKIEEFVELVEEIEKEL